MPAGLRRFHESRQSHFVTFSCFHRQAKFISPKPCDLFVECLERMRHRYSMPIYGYVVMSEHVHLLVSEPDHGTLADAMHYLKLSFAKRWRSRTQVSVQKADPNLGHHASSFWEKRYYDRNVRDEREFPVKLQYLHHNPVKRGLVHAPEDWKWSSFRHYALRESGVVEIESEWTAIDRERRESGALARTSPYRR